MTEEETALAQRLGASLRRHRQGRRWTQARLAEAADISINHVSYIERGERLPSVPMLVQLSQALGVTTSDLLGETETEPDPWVSRVLTLSHSLSPEAKQVVLAMLQGAIQGEEAVSEPGPRVSRELPTQARQSNPRKLP